MDVSSLADEISATSLSEDALVSEMKINEVVVFQLRRHFDVFVEITTGQGVIARTSATRLIFVTSSISRKRVGHLIYALSKKISAAKIFTIFRTLTKTFALLYSTGLILRVE